MTPEERAAAIMWHPEFPPFPEHWTGSPAVLEHSIVEAIRAAENDILERAEIALRSHQAAVARVDTETADLFHDAIGVVRALKTEG